MHFRQSKFEHVESELLQPVSNWFTINTVALHLPNYCHLFKRTFFLFKFAIQTDYTCISVSKVKHVSHKLFCYYCMYLYICMLGSFALALVYHKAGRPLWQVSCIPERELHARPLSYSIKSESNRECMSLYIPYTCICWRKKLIHIIYTLYIQTNGVAVT